MCKLTKTEIERRIKIDFPNDYDCTLLNIRDIMPDVSEEQIKLWENSQALEYVVIDGRKMYFRRAVRTISVNMETTELPEQNFWQSICLR